MTSRLKPTGSKKVTTGPKKTSQSRNRPEAPLLSPLRYPGSKRRLSGHLDEILQLNKREPDLFVEAFAGGASVAIRLLQLRRVKSVGLVDLDPLVASFWNAVFFDTKWLCDQVRTIPVSLAQWEAFRAMRPRSDRTRALVCLYLNRTSFSGILRPTAGPLGGYGQKGEYKIGCRFTRQTIIDRIERIAAYRDRVAFVWNMSWKEALAQVREKQAAGEFSSNVFYYFDPPFFEKAEDLYTFYFSDTDHVELRDELLEMTDPAVEPWVLSYDVSVRLEELYGGRPASTHTEFLYSMPGGGGRRIAKEAVLSNLPKLPIASMEDKRRSQQRSLPAAAGGLTRAKKAHVA